MLRQFKNYLFGRLSGVPTEFYNGVGGFSTPAGSGGGGLVLLASLIASASASLDVTTRNASGQSGAIIQSDFDDYLIELLNIKNATNTQDLLMKLSTDGGSTYDATNYYYGASNVSHTGSTGTYFGGPFASTSWKIFPVLDNSSDGLSAVIKLFNPAASAFRKSMIMDGTIADSSLAYRFAGFGTWNDNTAVNAFQFLMASGNITSGIVRIYGLEK